MTWESDEVDRLEAARARANAAGDKAARNDLEGQITRMGVQLRDIEVGPPPVSDAEVSPEETTVAAEPQKTTAAPKKRIRRNRT